LYDASAVREQEYEVHLMYAARFNTASAQGLPVRIRFPVNIYFWVQLISGRVDDPGPDGPVCRQAGRHQNREAELCSASVDQPRCGRQK